MGTKGGRLKAMSQKLSYALHNLTLMSAFSISNMRKHELREGIGKMQREFCSTEALAPPSPLMPWEYRCRKISLSLLWVKFVTC